MGKWQISKLQMGDKKMNVKMSHKWLVSLSVTLGMLILLWAIGSAMAQGPEPEESVSAAANVNSRISYQGVLTEGGTPVNGDYNMVFHFYTNSSCSGAAVQSVTKNNVQVTDGLFSVELDVDQSHFNGQGLWLRVQVGGTNLGCEEILPVPYALSLRPGAKVEGSVASPSAVIRAIQTSAGSAAFGVYGYAPTVGIYGLGVETGVKGHSYGHVGDRAGVYGESEMGVGVRGISTHNTGVYGESNGAYYHAGHFVNRNTFSSGQQVGVWTGSYWGNVIEGHDVDANGDSINRVFYVTRTGNVYADGAYYGAGGVHAGSADFAEMVLPGQEDLVPGDVLAIGSDGRMIRSTEPYQVTVVGVHSTEPGFVAGNKLDEEGNPLEPERIPLAVIGLVPVKASAENGPIAPGDLLVASSTPGHAMRADHFVGGAVIGKALEPLDEGTGVIQMLVMLQ
jgi:hypothetical protein